jgi:hypothetical protein
MDTANSGYAHSPMDHNKTALERAFELARSGTVLSVGELRAKIKREGYSAEQIEGKALGRQLRGLIAASSIGRS